MLKTIGGLSGAVATTALVDYIASVPAKEDRASKKEAQKLLDQARSVPMKALLFIAALVRRRRWAPLFVLGLACLRDQFF